MFINGICWRHFALGRIRPISIFLSPLNCKTKPLSPFKGNLVKILNLLLLPPWLFKEIPHCTKYFSLSELCNFELQKILFLFSLLLSRVDWNIEATLCVFYIVCCIVLCFVFFFALCCALLCLGRVGAFLPGINNPLPAAATGGMRGRILKSFKPFLQW